MLPRSFLSYIFLFSFLLLSVQGKSSNEYTFTTYSQKDGLAFNQVNCSYRDSDGFLWIGTRNGLSSFDGYRFQNYFHDYENPNSLAGNDISCIHEDIDGRIWIATWGGGVSVFDKQTKKFTNYNSKSKTHYLAGDDVIRLLYCDSKGRTWVATNAEDIVLIDHKKNTTKTFHTPGEKSFCSFLELSDDVMLIGTWKTLVEYQVQEDSLVQTKLYLNNHPIAVIKLSESEALIGGNEGIFRYTKGQKKLKKLADVKKVWGLSKSNNDLVIGTKNGIAFMDLDTYATQWVNTQLYTNHLFHDRKENIFWFAGKNGITRCERKEKKIKEHFLEHKFLDIETLSQTEFLGVTNSELIRFNLEGETKVLFSIPKTHIAKLSKINEQLYIFTSKGKLSFIDIQAQEKWDKEFTYFVNHAFYSPKTQHLFLINRLKIKEYLFDLESKKLKLLQEVGLSGIIKEKTNFLVRRVEEDNQGNVWIAVYGSGLLKLSSKNKSITQIVGEENRFIEEMTVDTIHQKIWLSSREGLMALDISNEKYNTAYTIKNRWLTLIEQDEKYIWLGSYNGILRYEIATSNYIVISEKSIIEKPLSHQSFITEKQIFALFEDKGFISLDRKLKKEKTRRDSVYVSNLTAGKHLYQNVEEKIELLYKENEVNISFSCVDFQHQNEHIFQTRMLGINKTWKDHPLGESRNVNYVDLSPGKYVFQVRLKGKEENKYAEVIFEILPPFWRTKIAYAIYISLFIGLLLLAYYLIKRSESKKNQIKEELVRIEEEKKYSKLRWRLFTDISHEIKTPLTLILSPLEEYLKGKEDKQLDFGTAQLVHRNAERLEQLVKQLLDFRKVESNMLKLNISEEDLVPTLKLLKESFQSLADQYEFDFQFHANEPNYLGYFDKDILERIIINLLSNAFKYTQPKGKVTLSIQIKKEKELAEISVSDTGIGMDKQTQANVFKRFQTEGEVQTEGFSSTGLGLSLVKELVKLHHADLNFDSKQEQGTNFQLFLPISRAFYESKKEQIIEALTEQSTVTEVTENQEKEYSILLAEDNLDIHHYLKTELEKEYRVFAFMNGKEAWGNIQDLMPDLVLSDIMMPEMTGIELCQKVKAEEKTSHIPVILLTAKGSHDNKVEGLESGADDYIKKPFRLEEIKARIKNMIRVRQQLQLKYSKEVLLEGNVLKSDSLDEQFIQKAIAIVEEYLEDPKFDNQIFCQEIGYGKTQLYTKLKALTNMSPNEFVRVIRLKKAAALIKQKNVNVSEVAYMVGFSSRSYFSTCFKEFFGVSPKKYQNVE